MRWWAPNAVIYDLLDSNAHRLHVRTNDVGNAVMMVDNTSTAAYNDKQNTVRIASKDEFSSRSVWVADMLDILYDVSNRLLSGHKRQTGLQVERSKRQV